MQLELAHVLLSVTYLLSSANIKNDQILIKELELKIQQASNHGIKSSLGCNSFNYIDALLEPLWNYLVAAIHRLKHNLSKMHNVPESLISGNEVRG